MAHFTLKQWAKQNEIKGFLLAQLAAGEKGDVEGVKAATTALNEAIDNLDDKVELWGAIRLERVAFDGIPILERPCLARTPPILKESD